MKYLGSYYDYIKLEMQLKGFYNCEKNMLCKF